MGWTLRFRKKKNERINKLSVQTPVPDKGRSGVAIAAICLNEGRYIEEWIRFHALAGIEDIYIYDDGSTDGTPDIAGATGKALGINVKVHDWAQRIHASDQSWVLNNQVLAYAHCISNYGGRFRWLAMIDLDEFLFARSGDNLTKALAPLEHCKCISLPWTMYGSNGHKVPAPQGVLRGYTARAPEPERGYFTGIFNIKTLIDPTEVDYVHIHRSKMKGASHTWNDRGEVIAKRGRHDPADFTRDVVQLNHYYTKSDSEFIAKIDGKYWGTGVDPKTREMLLERKRRLEQNATNDSDILEFIAKREDRTGTKFVWPSAPIGPTD